MNLTLSTGIDAMLSYLPDYIRCFSFVCLPQLNYAGSRATFQLSTNTKHHKHLKTLEEDRVAKPNPRGNAPAALQRVKLIRLTIREHSFMNH